MPIDRANLEKEDQLLAIRAFLLFASLIVAAGAEAQRLPVPIVNHENLLVAVSSKTAPTTDTVTQAIVNGAQARKWTISRIPDSSKIHAKLFVNKKHTVVVEIENTATTYSVRYVSSIDMKYGVENGVPVIHPFYNRWVNELIESIRTELVKL
jgi:hypothetical protein